MKVARHAFENGWSQIKLYFIGLPTETNEDLMVLLIYYKVLNLDEIRKDNGARGPQPK